MIFIIAEKIKSLREKLGYSQSQLAKHLKISRAAVNAWEMGLNTPSTQYIIELAKIFKTSTDYILGVNSDFQLNVTELSDEEKEIILKLLQYFHQRHNFP